MTIVPTIFWLLGYYAVSHLIGPYPCGTPVCALQGNPITHGTCAPGNDESDPVPQ